MVTYPPGPTAPPAAADRALAGAPDRVPRGLPAPLRRRVQRELPRLRDAAGDGLRPRGDPRALHRARHTACRRAARSRCGRSWAPRSVLLLEGAEHLARRKLMLPPFHGERMRAYEPIVREVAGARDRPLAGGRARSRCTRACRRSRSRSSCARSSASPTRRGASGCASCSAGCWRHGLARRCSARVLLLAASGGADPLAGAARRARRDRRAAPAEIADAGAPTRAARDILSLLVAARFEDGSRWATARSATS